jgi:cobalt-zinc-cadmium efflux system outer membrane protein
MHIFTTFTILALAAAAQAAPTPARSAAPNGPRTRVIPRANAATSDPPVRQAQADMAAPIPPPAPPVAEDGQSISLQAALYGAITSNPDLVTLRNSNLATPESVEVARRFPTTLNPTLWVDVRPLVYERVPGQGAMGPRMDQKDALMYFSWRQPIELGHQTTHRHQIAKAAYNQQQWTVVQSEMLALVQTYRFFQTAAYRREKLRVAQQLADFNDRLLQSLKRRLEAGQVQAADVALAEVENEATRQLVEVARQDYANALTDLHNQIGAPETAGTAQPLGEFILPANIPPLDDQGLIQLALQSRPEIHAARAAVAGASATVKLAKGDRIPTPVVGPVYERDEQGTQFFGFVYITPIPILNNGNPLVMQREADYRRAVVSLQQVEKRTVTQVKAAVAKWNAANRLVSQTSGLTGMLKTQVDRLEKLFDANQADLTKLLQGNQRLIQLENAQLDALWQATQSQADLLTALGAPTLLAALHGPGPRPANPAGAGH